MKPSLFSLCIAASLLVHVLFLALGPKTKNVSGKRPGKDIEIEVFNDTPTQAPQKKALPKGTVVDVPEAPSSKEKPKETTNLSHKNRVVPRETKALLRESKPQPPPEASQRDGNDQETPEPQQVDANSDRSQQNGEHATPQGRTKPLNLRPSREMLSKLVQPPDASNTAETKDEDKETKINTIEFLYTSFFNRIRSQIKYEWRPLVTYQSIVTNQPNNPPRRLWTVLNVVLDAKGRILHLSIARSSGFILWDEEALRAVQAATPFANPPPQLLNEQQQIAIQWGFIGETINQPLFHISD